MEIVKFIGLLAFTWLFVEGAAPVQFVKKLLKVHSANPPRDLTRRLILELVNCSLCSGFWIGLTYYWWVGNSPILMASLTAVGAELFARIINLIFNKYLNQL